MKLIDVLFCDDIRNEVYNKVSLMGLYNDRIVLHPRNQEKIEWPIKFDLSVLVRIAVDKDEAQPVNFQFEHNVNDKIIITIKGEADLSGSSNSVFSLVFSGNDLPLDPGYLGYSLKIFKKATGEELLGKIDKKALKIMEA